ncbi:MAG: NAD+ synthase [Nitrospiria bacterium]
MNKIRLALAQMNSTVGDLEGNAQKIFYTVEMAKRNDVDLIAFPEMAISGYPPEDLLLKPHFVEDNLEILNRVVEMTDGITVVIGFIDSREGLYNAAAVIQNRQMIQIYHKWHLPNYGVFDENRYFRHGKSAPVFKLKGMALGINICEDIWYKDGPAALQTRREGAKIIVNINASPYHLDKGDTREEMLAKRAKQTRAFIAYVNMVGGQDELVFDGGGLVFSEQGELIARGEAFKENLMIVDLPLNPPRSTELKSQDNKKKNRIFLPVIVKRKPQDEEIYQALVLGLSDYVQKNRFGKVVVGLSGGIDSALTAIIAVDGLGKDMVVGVFMPSRYTSDESREDAEMLARNLGIRLLTFSIESPFQSYLSLLSKSFEDLEADITEENLQARIRGNLMMALSNKFGWLVLTTGNKSEMSVGYATLYGDMAGGFSVIKDLWKTSVYRLAKMRNSQGDKVIPERIISRPPTAELRDKQCDQDSLPPYEILDPILRAYVEEDRSAETIVAMGFKSEIVAKVIALVDKSEFKRRQAPLGIKITSKALGKDRRMPITNRYRRSFPEGKQHNLKTTTNKRREKIA